MAEELKKQNTESGNAREVAIGIHDVTKVYKLYKSHKDRFRESLGLTRKSRATELYALRNVSFDVHRGECVGIIGTNGSGKSTILKIITGVLTQTSGDVNINGRISALLELGAGFNMEYTGLENIYLNGTMTGFSREEIDAKLQDILDFADIGDYIHQPCKTYSSGMFVRLAFAVAINIDPEILIVDEALSVGDVFFQSKCYRKFEEFKKEGRTILFVSHDLSSIAKYCDRVILLNKGVKRAEGEPREIVELYKKLIVHLDEGEAASLGEAADETIQNRIATAKVTGSLPQNPKTIEYGEGNAEIFEAVTLDQTGHETNTIAKGDSFQIRLRVHFNKDAKEPIFAYTFKNAQGTEITGTNTMFEKQEIALVHAGETVSVTFTQEMNLQGGEYLLSFGCTGFLGDDFHVFHRLYDVLSVTVVSEQNTVGFYDMNSTATLEVERA